MLYLGLTSRSFRRQCAADVRRSIAFAKNVVGRHDRWSLPNEVVLHAERCLAYHKHLRRMDRARGIRRTHFDITDLITHAP